MSMKQHEHMQRRDVLRKRLDVVTDRSDAPISSPIRQRSRRGALSRILQDITTDRATMLAALGNITSFAVGPITVTLIALRLSADMQGYYYTFGSLMNLQYLLEGGLGQT